jgi:hypothetical protein
VSDMRGSAPLSPGSEFWVRWSRGGAYKGMEKREGYAHRIGWPVGHRSGLRRGLEGARSAQPPFALQRMIPLIARRMLLPLTILDIATATVIFMIGELAISPLLFKLHIRNRPF